MSYRSPARMCWSMKVVTSMTLLEPVIVGATGSNGVPSNEKSDSLSAFFNGLHFVIVVDFHSEALERGLLGVAGGRRPVVVGSSRAGALRSRGERGEGVLNSSGVESGIVRGVRPANAGSICYELTRGLRVLNKHCCCGGKSERVTRRRACSCF